jgi:hypothetical protein
MTKVTRLEEEIPDEIEEELLDKENVIGVGRGRKRVDGRFTDEEVVVTFVEKKVEEDELDEDQIVPTSVEIDDQRVGTDVQEAPGGFYAQGSLPSESVESHVPPDASGIGQGVDSRPMSEPRTLRGPFGQTRRDRWRPLAPAGVSIGHPSITAGTLGSPPLFTQGGERVFLTNAHVAAPAGKAERGDSCIQPGRADGGTEPKDTIGELLEWSDLSEKEDNISDSALVRITGDVENNILSVGPLRGWTEANYEEEHTKSGRTTGTTSSDLIARDATALVTFGEPFSEPLRFTGLDVFEAFSTGGDSGSLIGVQRRDGFFYGTSLLFAGSVRQTLAIPMAAVQEVHGDLRVERRRGRRIDRGERLESDQGGQEPLTERPPKVPPEFQQGMEDRPGRPPDSDPMSFSDVHSKPEPPALPAENADTALPPELSTGPQAAVRGVRRVMTGRLDPKATVHRWIGPYDAREIISFSARPTTRGRYVQGSVVAVWRSSNEGVWYYLRVHNPHTTPTDYEVIAADSAALR